MAESVVSFVVEKLGNLLIEEAAFLQGVEDEVRQLQIELKRMQCFLKDADNRQKEDERVRNWVSEIRDAAYDAEDAIETFALEISYSNKRSENSLKRFVPAFDKGRKLHKLGSKIKAIKATISDLTRSLQTYGVTSAVRNEGSSSDFERQRQLRWSYSHVVEEYIVGLDENIVQVVEQLVNVEKSCQVVSIWGMGGLGKTTLAKEVYHHRTIRRHFEGFAWAYISQQCKFRDVWEGTLIKLTSPSKDERDQISQMKDEEDFDIPTKKLVRLWVAEAFVSPEFEGEGDEMLEDIAELYLIDLINRCIVEVGVIGASGRIKSCRLHDLMRDLCLSKAKQENFLHIVSGHETDPISSHSVRRVSSTGRIRRLAIFSGSFLPENYKKNPIRSVLYFNKNNQQIESMFEYFKLLRVLDVEGIQLLNVVLPEEIGRLVHLRYLSLKKTGMRKLPSSIGNLVCLETLNLETIDDLGWESTVELPDAIWKMERLRHLYLPKWCDNSTDDKLQLANLRNLQTLVNLPANKCDLRDLLSLTNLRKLVLNDSRHFHEFGPIINHPNKKLRNLQSLSMKAGLLSFPHKVIDIQQVVQGCPRLWKLHLEGRIEKLPDCHEFPRNLAKLTLWGSSLVEDVMPTLGKLPNLRVLSGWEVFVGKQMVCLENGFPKLESLLLRGLLNLEEWTVESGAMSSLRYLKISNCIKLKMVPDGLRSVSTLQELEIRWMPRTFKLRLEGEDFFKVQHVPSIIFLN
ncbi:hypothetical protein I3843_04G048000 [Carya illinoinensis]|nr:hypothetical protein I3843_04G048000 [Carya illinoinensis]